MESSTPVILVVDDNPSTRYSTGRILRAAGFVIREAATGREALEMAEDPPHAVVLDVNLPDIDGFEVCSILKAREKTSCTPIIYLSATFVEAGDKVQGLESGADAYLTHPVEPQVLVATINAFLRARNAEERMRRSEEKFRAIFDQAVNGIVLMSEDQVYLEVNPAMCRILGRERDEIVGRRGFEFMPPGHEDLQAEISRKLAADRAWSGSFPLLRPDGSLVELEWNISIHSLPGVRLAVVTDITERRAAENERERLLGSERAARTEAERASRLKDEFLATVSHELRSPLNAIVGWSHVLKMRGTADLRDYRAGVEAIERNAKVQAQLIADLLDVSRITSGKMRLELQRVEMEEVIHHSVDGVRAAAVAKNIAIEQDIDPRGTQVSGDPVRLQQVMGNLLANAIKFTPQGGHVFVRLRRSPSGIEIAVIDDGQGISAEFLPFIFDTFRQEDAAASRSHEGLGLGLAIVKRLVEMHGGSVCVRSAGEGKGATFVVTLPLPPSERDVEHSPPQAPVADVTDTEALRGLRLLVVDDDADARMIVRRLMIDYDVDVIEAATVVEALALMEACNPQLILSDIGMPKDDGYQLIRQVRARGCDVPAIALTAFVQPEDRARVLSAGFAAHLMKPVNPDKLISTVASFAQRRGA